MRNGQLFPFFLDIELCTRSLKVHDILSSQQDFHLLHLYNFVRWSMACLEIIRSGIIVVWVFKIPGISQNLTWIFLLLVEEGWRSVL